MKPQAFNIHDVVLIISTVMCFVNIALLTNVVNYGTRATATLGWFFAALAVSQLGLLLIWSEHLRMSQGVASLIVISVMSISTVIKGPLIWAYACALTQTSIQKTRFLVGLILVSLLVVIAVINLSSAEFVWRSNDNTRDELVFYLWLVLKIIPVAFGIAALWQLRRLRYTLESHFANNIEDAPRWLYILIGGFSVKWFYDLGIHLLRDNPSAELSNVLGLASNYSGFALIVLLFAYLISDANSMTITTSKPHNDKPTKNESPTNTALLEQIEHLMRAERFYLNPNINLERFAEQLGASEKEVSSLINQHFQQNFFEFVNHFRVEEAKRLLKDEPEMSVTVVFSESGFNSKSAFQRFFKRFTGTTPTAYRQSHK